MRMDQVQSKVIGHASWAVSLLMAKATTPHSIEEALMKSWLASCTGILLGKFAASKWSKFFVPTALLSPASSTCRATSIKESLIYTIRLDERMRMANLSQVIFFVRYVHNQRKEEDLLFYRPLKTTNQAADLMQLVDAFFKKRRVEMGQARLCIHRWGRCWIECEIWIYETTEPEEFQGS